MSKTLLEYRQSSKFEWFLTRIRHLVCHRALGACPALFLPLARVFVWINGAVEQVQVVNRKTELVIDGFPRSANTFATEAFQAAQGKDVQIAHHVHAPAHIIKAVRAEIPALVLIRAPMDAIRSYRIRCPWLSVEDLLKDYGFFYEKVLPYKESYVVATFEQITKDFGRVIRRVNDKFGTDFKEFQHTSDNVQKCFAKIEERTRRISGDHAIAEQIVSRPSSARDFTELSKIHSDDSKLPMLRNRAVEMCRIFYELAGGSR